MMTDVCSISQFATYEDYLESQISPNDLKYLEDESLARQLVELGYRGSAETLKREEFEARRREFDEMKYKASHPTTTSLSSTGKDLTGFPFLQELAKREGLVRSGKLATIIFIRDKNMKGQEVSGYIDYGHRLKNEDFTPYFSRKKRLFPKPSDLSFYNWDTNSSTNNPTVNFQVIADHERNSLLFKNKRDRKVINVDPDAQSGDNSSRHEIDTPEYIQVVIYDHLTRRRS